MHLIITCAVAYIILQSIKIIFFITAATPKTVFSDLILPQVALQPWQETIRHPWVLLSYFWLHASFFNMLSNMLWLYCFGSVIQSFVGHKEIVPLFLTSGILSGLIFSGISFLWPSMPETMIITTLPVVMAFAVGAFVLVPGYRFYLGERLSVPLWIVVVVFLMLNVLSVANNRPLMMVVASAALIGAAYIWLLKAGYQPGARLSGLGHKVQSVFAPRYDQPLQPSKRRNLTLKNRQHYPSAPTQEYIDTLLDKINQKGYTALSEDEKEALMKASKDKQ
jgi:membrane associated rhomboid family serine protease